MLAFFAKTNVVAFGLAGMFFSTGASLGTNSNMLYRMRKLFRTSLSPLKEKTTYEDLSADESGLQSVRTWQKSGDSGVQQAREKPAVGHMREPGHVIYWASGGLASLLLIAFILVSFGFPHRIFLLNSKNGDLEQDNNNNNGSNQDEMIQDTPNVIAQSETSNTQQPEESSLVTPIANSQIEMQSESGDALLFAEDFNSTQLSATPLFNIEYMRYYHAEGQGVIESAVHPGLLPIMFKQIRTDDFIAEFDFVMPDASYDSSCGLLFRSNATTKEGLDQYYALFLFPKTNVLKMGIFKENELSFTSAIEPDPPFQLGYEYNHIRLDVNGEKMDIYLNGVFVTGFNEGSLRDPGWIGFFLYPSDFLSDGEVDYVLFDNLMIYKK